MRTITYTYDEENPTNRDYLIAALTDSIDDGGASYDSALEYNIDCPYINSTDCLNIHEDNEYGTATYGDGCLRCKVSWLNRRYDTYPSYDGRWEVEGD
jgi:hypothetical protein